MLEPTALTLFIIASVVLLLTPGPAVMYIVTRSIDQGRLAGIVSALGVGVGVFETLLNTAFAQRHGDEAARPLTLLHSAATVGAVLAPPVFAWVSSTTCLRCRKVS